MGTPHSSLRPSSRQLNDPSLRARVMTSARILIVADLQLRREALAGALVGRGMNVVGACAPDEAIDRACKDRPQVALLDVRPDHGLGLAAQLLSASPPVRSVMVCVSEGEVDLISSAETGLAAYVTARESLDDMIAVVTKVMDEDISQSASVSAALLREARTLASVGPAGTLATLTVRETEVADLLTLGLSNKEIAFCLAIALPTVKAHVHSILGKLNARRRGEAVARIRARQVAGYHDLRIGRTNWTHLPIADSGPKPGFEGPERMEEEKN